MSARSATERRPKYSSLSIAWWLVSAAVSGEDSLVVDRREVQGSVRAVDVADEFGGHALELRAF